jgi:hypothetical protein
MDYNIREIQYLIREALTADLITETLSLEQAKCLALNSPYFKLHAQDLTVRGKAVLLHGIKEVLLQRAMKPGFDWEDIISKFDKLAKKYGDTAGLVSTELNDCLFAETEGMTGGSVSAAPRPSAYSQSLREELTKTDESDIKKMIAKELESAQSSIGKNVKKIVEEELGKMIQSKDIKDDITDITKKVMKRLYKDLSYHHPYIIDRIKV